MATEKKRVQGYLSETLYIALTQYAESKKISQSQALEELLLKALSLSELPSELKNELPSELKDELPSELLPLISERFEEKFKLLTTKLELIEQAIKPSELPSELPIGLTHTELSKKLGVARSTVSRWAGGQIKLPPNLEYTFNSKVKRWFLIHG